MNSSAKYQRFTQESEHSKTRRHAGSNKRDSVDELSIERSGNGRCLLIALATTIVILVAVFVAAGLAIGIGVGVGVSQQKETQGVTVITISPAEFEGTYTSSEGEGSIRFRSTVNDTHFVLNIYTLMDGNLIVTITHPLTLNMTLMGLNSTNFLIMKDLPGHPKYLVPDDMMDMMGSVMSGDETMTNEILQELDSTNVDQMSHDVLFSFMTSPEALLIVQAAQTLGEQGYQGMDYPALMQFYQLALKIVKINLATASEIDDEDSPLQRRSSDSFNSHTREKRFFSFIKSFTRRLVCSRSSQRRCKLKPYTSPYDPNDKCFGLCGYGCCCWKFVCGDCCRHRYCETHDDCCARMGFFTIDCFLVGIDVLFSACSDKYDLCF